VKKQGAEGGEAGKLGGEKARKQELTPAQSETHLAGGHI